MTATPLKEKSASSSPTTTLSSDRAFVGFSKMTPGSKLWAKRARVSPAVKLAKETRPDGAVLDISMPELGGIEASSEILKEIPDTKIPHSQHALGSGLHPKSV